MSPFLGWTRELEALALLLPQQLSAESYREAVEKTGLCHVGPFYTRPLLETLGIQEVGRFRQPKTLKRKHADE